VGSVFRKTEGGDWVNDENLPQALGAERIARINA
jgi:hypothetical protein